MKIDLESLLHLLSGHPRLFKQDASGEQIVVSPSLVYEDWLCVNPYALLRGEGVNGGIEDPEKKKKEIEEQVSAELAREQQEEAKEEEEEEGEDDTPSLLKREDAFLSEKERGQLSVSSFNQEQVSISLAPCLSLCPSASLSLCISIGLFCPICLSVCVWALYLRRQRESWPCMGL